MATPGCFIVPPYILDALSRADDPVLAARAARTLAEDERLRAERAAQSRPGAVATAEAPPPEPGVTGRLTRAIFDAGNQMKLPGRKVRDEGSGPTGDVEADEAYDGFGATHRMFVEAFERDSMDGEGLPLLGTVHYGKGYDCEHRDCATTWGLTLAYDRPCGCPRVDVSAPGGGVHQAAGRVGSDLIGA